MTLTRLTLIAALMLVGCGETAGDNSSNSNSTDNSSNPNSSANNQSSNSANNSPFGPTPDRPALVEAEDCFAEPSKPLLEGDEIQYSQATEGDLLMPRMSYGSSCGSAMEAEIDWIAVFSSNGFDDDEYDNPGAVATALTPFFNAGQEFCYDSTTGEVYRATVERVVFLPTEADDRVGLCFEEENSTLVYRFKLNEGDYTATALTEAEVGQWLADNIQ